MLSLLQRKSKGKTPIKPFSAYAKPTSGELQNAANALVYTEKGEEIRFGDLWEGQRTIICFIRHYWWV